MDWTFQPNVAPIPNPDGAESDYLYRLVEDYEVQFTLSTCCRSSTYRVVIPEGFIYDGTSGRPYTAIFGVYPDGLERLASIIHDYLYVNQGRVPIEVLTDDDNWVTSNRVIERSEADFIFFSRLCSTDGYSGSRAKKLFDVVKTFGGIWWDSHGKPTKEQVEHVKARITLNV